jgi:hypothetical protein
MISITHPTTDEQVEVTISYSFSPPSRGHCDRFGCPEEPDTPAEYEVESIEVEDSGEELDFDSLRMSDQERILIWCEEDAESRAEDYPERDEEPIKDIPPDLEFPEDRHTPQDEDL